MSDGTCYIYIIAIDEVGMVKVGISDNPQKRLSQLTTGSPFKMRIEHSFAAPSRKAAEDIERGFHRVYADKRGNGEWFKMKPHAASLALSLSLIKTIREALPTAEPEDLSATFQAIGFPKWTGIDEYIFSDRLPDSPGTTDDVTAQ